jgi:putative sporulation protein YyaC
MDFRGIKTKEQLVEKLGIVIPKKVLNDDIIYLCIGTDRSTGDSLAPLVGTFLSNMGYKNIIGTLNDPLHAANLSEKTKLLPKNKIKIAIDATLSDHEYLHTYSVRKGSIIPGAGVGKKLDPVGDYSITGVVNIGGFMEYLVLANTRLSVIMNMAEDIKYAITKVLPNNSNIESIAV